MKRHIILGMVFVIGWTFVSCNKEEVQEYPSESTSISYLLTMSPDLLKFVYPEVTYVDVQGVLHTVSGVEELDRLVQVNFAYTPGIGVWTVQTIKGTNYKCWNLNMNFKNRPFHSYVGVKYKKRELVENIPGTIYDFHHSIFTTTIHVASNFKITTKSGFWKNPETNIEFGSGAFVQNQITITKNSEYTSEEVEQYVNDLVNTPDKAGFVITADGQFVENTDFSL